MTNHDNNKQTTKELASTVLYCDFHHSTPRQQHADNKFLEFEHLLAYTLLHHTTQHRHNTLYNVGCAAFDALLRRDFLFLGARIWLARKRTFIHVL